MRIRSLIVALSALSPAALGSLLSEPESAVLRAPEVAASEGSSRGFPGTAHEYAKMVEPILGVPPKVNLDEAVEIPLYVDGERAYGNLGTKLDNPSRLGGKSTVSGSVIQRYEGRTAEGEPMPDVVWVAFGRNSSSSPRRVIGSVQLIGYHKKTGATAFFESSDRLGPWVKLDDKTLRMRGTMPWVDDADEFNRAYRTPGAVQCVACHQADPFITNTFINAAKIPGTEEPVIPILDENSPYYVIGGENWDMRTIHVEDNGCFECHRVGMATIRLFQTTGWHPNDYMPPDEKGSLKEDWEQLLEVWREGPEKVEGAEWILPPAKGEDRRVVGDDYPHKADFNRPGADPYGAFAMGEKSDKDDGKDPKKGWGKKVGKGSAKLTKEQRAEVDGLLKQVEDEGIRRAFADWINENGLDESTLAKLRSYAKGGGKGGKTEKSKKGGKKD